MADNAFPLPGVTAIQTVGDWENFFHPAFGSGVVPDAGSALVPSLDAAGRHIVIQPGAAIVRAFYKPVSAATYTAIPAASSQNRIDRLVLRLNRAAADAASFVQPVVITGTPSASPQVPALTRTTAGLWDLPVAHWTSASDGSLSGLVDERVMTSSPMVVMSASGGTPSLDRAGILIQPDTGNLLMSPSAGAAWREVYAYDTWHSGGAGANNWNVSSPPDTYFYYKTVAPGMVAVTFQALLPKGSGSPVQVLSTALPAAYRPKTAKSITIYTDRQRVDTSAGNNQQAVLSIGADGIVRAYGVASSASDADGCGVYPVDSPY